ncbi:MAG: hypothetical protein HYZ15_13745 [Sphingobacteriales bacterium]|nr:hypothetical protein [Sphingobacteriales bacterium]
MKKSYKSGCAVLLLLTSLFSKTGMAQAESQAAAKPDYTKVYRYCLDGDVMSALRVLGEGGYKLSRQDSIFKTRFESRFKGATDHSDYIGSRRSPIDGLLGIFQSYWRKSLLDNSGNYDTALLNNLFGFLQTTYSPGKQLFFNNDSLDRYLGRYISSLGLHTTGLGKTGRLYDLLVWGSEKDTTYSFTLNREKISSRVMLMDKFVTLGWEEYATLDKYYPGGWATDTALYCVKKGYDLSSEAFLISYLAHESRHFADYKLFAKLSSADLEYRAKLTELSMAKETLFKLLSSFINNANAKSNNGHSIANFCVIRDLSGRLFKTGFEADISKWKKLRIKKVNRVASKLLRSTTKQLLRIGRTVEKYISVLCGFYDSPFVILKTKTTQKNVRNSAHQI